MAYPRHQRARAFRTVKKSSGNFAPTGQTTWGDLDTGLDLTIEAQVGDVIEASLVTAFSNEAADIYIDAVTLVSGSPVTFFSCSGGASDFGCRAWFGYASRFHGVGGSTFLTLVSGDISSGKVTVRLRYRNDVATARTVVAATTGNLIFAIKNLGPADPE